VTCKLSKSKKKPKITCKVTYKTKRTRAAWRLTRGKRTVAHGVAKARNGRAAVDTGALRGLRRGSYRLTITLSGGGSKSVVSTSVIRVG
jgi:hypothetical protein